MAVPIEKLLELQRETTCGICRRYFSEPVTISCGHSFCTTCLSWSWRLGATPSSCPECRQVPEVGEIPGVNGNLAELTELVKQLCFQNLQSAEGLTQCTSHKLMLKLFCEDDQTPLCVRCPQSPEHGTHKLSPVEEAAQQRREKLGPLRRHLGKHLEEAEELLAEEGTAADAWVSMITGEYCELKGLVMEEKKRCLERMKEEDRAEQEVWSQYVHTLQELMLELKEAHQQPDLDLLREVRQLLGRSGAVLSQRAKVMSPVVRECPIPGMMEMFSRFRVGLTMDPSSANSGVIVSEDRKSVKARENWQEENKHPEEAVGHYVFAEQAFSSGGQYWEVNVSQLPQWILGIHNPHFRERRGRSKDSCGPVFLLSCVKKEEDYYLHTYPGSLNHRVKSPVPRVGVYLGHTPGTLAFYNVLQHSLIYRFYPILLTGPVTPFFFPGPPLPGTKAGPLILCPVDSHLCACCYSSE